MSSPAREQSPSAAPAIEAKMESGVAAQSPPSDNDGGERPVRQQLQNTNIDSVNGSAHINRKRSLEDADGAADEHPTKRSREGTPESSSQPAPAGENSAAPGVQPTDQAATKPNDSDVKEQEKPKPSEPTKDESTKGKESNSSAFESSAFGMASTGSPFGLTNANASASPFALNNANPTASPFATTKPTSTPSSFENSAFNSTSAASPFATGGTSSFGGFGGLKSGSSFAASPFSNPLGSKSGKVTSFASPNIPAPLGDSKSKQLGATAAENEESDDESEAEPNDTFVAEKTDERFHEKTVETGEENETTKFAAKGKLYYFDEQWKERGAGTFKVNTKTDSDGNMSGRMIMRADGALRVTLNSAIFHDMNHGDSSGKRPTSKDIYLATKEDGKVGLLLLRLGNVDQSTELYDVLEEILKDFPQTAKK